MTDAPARKRICVWCSPPKVLSDGVEPASHTMCDDCSRVFEAEAMLPLDKRLDDLPYPVPTMGGHHA